MAEHARGSRAYPGSMACAGPDGAAWRRCAGPLRGCAPASEEAESDDDLYQSYLDHWILIHNKITHTPPYKIDIVQGPGKEHDRDSTFGIEQFVR